MKQPVGVGKLSPQMVQWFPLLIGRVIESLLDDLTAGCGLPLQNRSCVLSACVVLKFELHFEHWKLISWFYFFFMVKVKQTSGGGGGGIEVERRRSATIPVSGIWLGWVCLSLQNLTWVLIPFFLKNLWQKQQAILILKFLFISSLFKLYFWLFFTFRNSTLLSEFSLTSFPFVLSKLLFLA